MGLLNFILKHFQTTNPSDNGQPPTKTQQGTFLNDDDSANRKNPIGIFNCDTMDCLSHRLRYIPAPNETIADTMRCPDCGHWMIHEALEDEYRNLSQKIYNGSSGSRQVYQMAIEALPLTERILAARSLVKTTGTPFQSYAYDALDTILDLAPIVFDESSLKAASRCMEKFTLDDYPPSLIPPAIASLHKLKTFYKQLENSKTYKQVELKKELLAFYPDVGDPTWIFYVWSNFGFFKRANIKNRVYLTKQPVATSL